MFMMQYELRKIEACEIKEVTIKIPVIFAKSLIKFFGSSVLGMGRSSYTKHDFFFFRPKK